MEEKVCSVCNFVKPIKEFTKDKQKKCGLCSRCKECDKKKAKKYLETIDGFMAKLLCSSKNHSKTRTSNGRDEAGKFDITLEYLCELWKKQDGY